MSPNRGPLPSQPHVDTSATQAFALMGRSSIFGVSSSSEQNFKTHNGGSLQSRASSDQSQHWRTEKTGDMAAKVPFSKSQHGLANKATNTSCKPCSISYLLAPQDESYEQKHRGYGQPGTTISSYTVYQPSPNRRSAWRPELEGASKTISGNRSPPWRSLSECSPTSTSSSRPPSSYSGGFNPSRRSTIAKSHATDIPSPASRKSLLNYELSMRQQPVAARACGFGDRDRRVIDPPPILQLKITDPATGAPAQDPYAMLAVHCSLIPTRAADQEPYPSFTDTETPATRRLMGTLVASPYTGKDEHGVAGMFFVFSDLSCRMPGGFRLQFRLLRVDPTNMMPGTVHGCVASIETAEFAVYAAKDFPGMRPSTALLIALREQGLNVGLKKGRESKHSKRRRRDDSDDSSVDSESGEESTVKRRRKSRKSRLAEG